MDQAPGAWTGEEWARAAWPAVRAVEQGLAEARAALTEAAAAEWVSDAGNRYREELAAQHAQLVRLAARVAGLEWAVLRHRTGIEAARAGLEGAGR